MMLGKATNGRKQLQILSDITSESVKPMQT